MTYELKVTIIVTFSLPYYFFLSRDVFKKETKEIPAVAGMTKKVAHNDRRRDSRLRGNDKKATCLRRQAESRLGDFIS